MNEQYNRSTPYLDIFFSERVIQKLNQATKKNHYKKNILWRENFYLIIVVCWLQVSYMVTFLLLNRKYTHAFWVRKLMEKTDKYVVYPSFFLFLYIRLRVCSKYRCTIHIRFTLQILRWKKCLTMPKNRNIVCVFWTNTD